MYRIHLIEFDHVCERGGKRRWKEVPGRRRRTPEGRIEEELGREDKRGGGRGGGLEAGRGGDGEGSQEEETGRGGHGGG
jgi:hypothetical protein